MQKNAGFLHRDSPEVRAREEVNVLKTSMCTSVQELAVQMQHAKQKESQDPMYDSNSDHTHSNKAISDASSP